jgi:hypothetical protein
MGVAASTQPDMLCPFFALVLKLRDSYEHLLGPLSQVVEWRYLNLNPHILINLHTFSTECQPENNHPDSIILYRGKPRGDVLGGIYSGSAHGSKSWGATGVSYFSSPVVRKPEGATGIAFSGFSCFLLAPHAHPIRSGFIAISFCLFLALLQLHDGDEEHDKNDGMHAGTPCTDGMKDNKFHIDEVEDG